VFCIIILKQVQNKKGGMEMPTYEYLCENCQKEFSMILSFSEHEKGDIFCPECKSKQVKQLISTFVAQTSKKS